MDATVCVNVYLPIDMYYRLLDQAGQHHVTLNHLVVETLSTTRSEITPPESPPRPNRSASVDALAKVVLALLSLTDEELLGMLADLDPIVLTFIERLPSSPPKERGWVLRRFFEEVARYRPDLLAERFRQAMRHEAESSQAQNARLMKAMFGRHDEDAWHHLQRQDDLPQVLKSMRGLHQGPEAYRPQFEAYLHMQAFLERVTPALADPGDIVPWWIKARPQALVTYFCTFVERTAAAEQAASQATRLRFLYRILDQVSCGPARELRCRLSSEFPHLSSAKTAGDGDHDLIHFYRMANMLTELLQSAPERLADALREFLTPDLAAQWIRFVRKG